MRNLMLIMSLFLLCSTARADNPRLADVGWLAQQGTWTIDGNWSNGNPFRGAARYERALDGKFIAGRSWTLADDGPVAREAVIFGEQDGRLAQWTFARDGSARISMAEHDAEDGAIVFPWTRTAPDGATQRLKQRLKRDADGQFSWSVMMEIRGEWHALISGQWVLDPAASDPLPSN